MSSTLEHRIARSEDVPGIVALADQMFRSQPGQVSLGESFSHLLSAGNADNLYVVDDNGKIVSLLGWYPTSVNIAGCSVKAASLGAVSTDPEYRKQGFATSMLRTALQRLKEEEVCLLLIYGSRGLYLSHDCMFAGQMASFTIAGDTLLTNEPIGAQAEIRPWEESDLSAIIQVWESEEMYFERTPEEFLHLIRTETLLSTYPAKQHLLVRSVDGKADSYIVFGVWEKGGQTFGEVIEFAGSDQADLQLMQEALKQFGMGQLKVSVPNHRKSLAEQLVSCGCTFRSESIPGTIRITNFPALWASLQPYFEQRLGAAQAAALSCVPVDQGYRIAYGEEAWTVDLRAATTLVFNGPQLTGNGALKEVLGRMFPLPFSSPLNLNFI